MSVNEMFKESNLINHESYLSQHKSLDHCTFANDSPTIWKHKGTSSQKTVKVDVL